MKYDPTVFVVDDDDAVRDALSISLYNAGLQVECFNTGEGFLNAYSPERPGCLLLDLRMPGMDGLALQQELCNRRFSIPIVFMTAYGSIRDSVSAVKAGAVDFLEKPVSSSVLLDRIRNALEMDAQIREAQRGMSDVKTRYDRLSPREREIMAFIAEGKSSKQIAQLLGISPRTVDAHRSHIREKLGLADGGELTRHAIRWIEVGTLEPV